MDIHTELVISPHFDARQGIDKTVAHRLVYTDGSCLNNGRPDATGGIGIWFGTESAYNGGMVYPFPSPTNNACELFAVCMALAVVQEQSQLGTMELFEKLYVFTGSQYVLMGARRSDRMHAYNTKLWDMFHILMDSFQDWGCLVTIAKVAAHQGIRGNDEADRIARTYSEYIC
ncbi:Ribonuclease H1 [Batrachochytrium dendrobatidis]